ncbi:hypothetical protein O3M35_004834 [Rhynocoris fuscipes]|uniref:Uncharacterized protein n=1 Tax=Rhynocoris fuscipes TaxID=488301 RepID=A0AAW1DLZ5_9HEMI
MKIQEVLININYRIKINEDVCLVAQCNPAAPPAVLVEKRKAQEDPDLNRELKKAKQQLRLLSPEGHGVSKCTYTWHAAEIEPMVPMENASVRVYDLKSTIPATLQAIALS